jgi:hypothetical protein
MSDSTRLRLSEDVAPIGSQSPVTIEIKRRELLRGAPWTYADGAAGRPQTLTSGSEIATRSSMGG